MANLNIQILLFNGSWEDVFFLNLLGELGISWSVRLEFLVSFLGPVCLHVYTYLYYTQTVNFWMCVYMCMYTSYWRLRIILDAKHDFQVDRTDRSSAGEQEKEEQGPVAFFFRKGAICLHLFGPILGWIFWGNQWLEWLGKKLVTPTTWNHWMFFLGWGDYLPRIFWLLISELHQTCCAGWGWIRGDEHCEGKSTRWWSSPCYVGSLSYNRTRYKLTKWLTVNLSYIRKTHLRIKMMNILKYVNASKLTIIWRISDPGTVICLHWTDWKQEN